MNTPARWKRAAAAISITAAMAVGCSHAAAPPPRLTRDMDLEALQVAVGWPEPAVPTVMALANQYVATHRDADGQATFCERARQVPSRPLFGALCGMFQARRAGEVPLLRRIASVEEALAMLDRAAATDGLSRFLRGQVSAALPARFGRASQAVDDLQWMLARAGQFPPGLRRGAYDGLATAYGTLGQTALAEQARAHAHLPAGPTLLADGSMTAADGYRFCPPALVSPAPGVYVARCYDFADISFVITDAGVVAIDAGTTESSARAALDAFRAVHAGPIVTLILTHAHWDHIGGVRVLAGPHTEVIAQAGFAAELARINATGVPFRYFFGRDVHLPFAVSPGHLVLRPETITVGGTRFALHPTRGGETEDALLVHLPDRGVVFVGDAFMPYFGAPFVAEGAPEGFFDTVALIQSLAPRLLVHGHAPLTDNFPVAVLAPLSRALRDVHTRTLAAIQDAHPLVETLQLNLLPSALASAPGAVVPFLLMRDNFIKRLYAQRTGYWKSDGEGMAVFSTGEWAAALDLVADGQEDRLVQATSALVTRGDLELGLRLAEIGLASHPGSAPLAAARRRALEGLRGKHLFNPFKFIIYSEMAGVELPAVEPIAAAPRAAASAAPPRVN